MYLDACVVMVIEAVPWVDPDGVEWREYECSYNYEDRQFCFEIWARSMDVAQNRVNLMGIVQLDGELGGTVTDE